MNVVKEIFETNGLKISRTKTEFSVFGFKNEVIENGSDHNIWRMGDRLILHSRNIEIFRVSYARKLRNYTGCGAIGGN